MVFIFVGVITKEEKSTVPNPDPGTKVSSHSDSSSTGVVQQFNYGTSGGNEDDMSSRVDSINKRFQEWQEKFQQDMNTFNMHFQQEMDSFNMNFQKEILKDFHYSS